MPITKLRKWEKCEFSFLILVFKQNCFEKSLCNVCGYTRLWVNPRNSLLSMNLVKCPTTRVLGSHSSWHSVLQNELSLFFFFFHDYTALPRFSIKSPLWCLTLNQRLQLFTAVGSGLQNRGVQSKGARCHIRALWLGDFDPLCFVGYVCC